MSETMTDHSANNYVPVPESGCWLWLGSWNAGGYGQISSKAHRTAHRAFYAAHKGAIPDGLFVCHKCDTRACVNPDHLFVGTPKDNVSDMVRKGRGRIEKIIGSRNPKSKLSEADVLAIASSDESQQVLAERYGVHRTTIGNVRLGRYWGHITTSERTKITTDQAVLALKAISLSSTARLIAERMGTDSRAVATALRGAVNDGRVTITYRYRGDVGLYRFNRLRPAFVAAQQQEKP